jgi:hypothetical protein
MHEQKYEMRITATGTVRDADGNIISQEPIETTQILTEDEAKALLTQGDQS